MSTMPGPHYDSSRSSLKKGLCPSNSYTIPRDDRNRVDTHRFSTYYAAELRNNHCDGALIKSSLELAQEVCHEATQSKSGKL